MVGVEFRVLGTVQAYRDGHQVDLGGPRSRAVLAVLLLHPGQPLSREQLIEYAWETTSGRPEELVAASVYYLRQALAPDEERVRLASEHGEFAVQVEPTAVDAHRFLALLEPPDADTVAHDSERSARLREALGLWRGNTSALIGARSRWLRSHARMLEGRRLDAIEELALLHLDAGRTQDALDLVRDVTPVPEREGLTAVTIRALLAAGQASRAELLADGTISTLRQQGREPGPVLRAARGAALGTRTVDPPHAPRQLPPDTTLFTGRRSELAHLLALAEQAGAGNSPGTVVIFAIDGMGGVGKSALAISAGHRLAARYPDGQLFLDLHGHTQSSAPRMPGDALATLLSSLGVPPQQIPADVEARAALYRDRLAGTRTLIVLDNAVDEAQVRPLLPAAENCLVLITSRTRLKALDDAVPLPLDVLPLGEAATLLRKAARLDERPQDEPLLARVAELCGRLPLALLIAAALLRTGGRAWNLNLLIDRLAARRSGHELAGFTDETRNLTTVFDLSYRDLPEDQRLLFRRLALLPGPEIDAYAAAALLDSDRDQADALLQRLADHNLLSGTAPGRYRIHDLIRAHARTHNPDRNGALDRLLRYYAHTAKTASLPIARIPRPTPDGPAPAYAPALLESDIARAWLRVERPNLYAAFTYARTHALNEHVIALAAGLAEILRTDGPWSLALEIHQSAAKTAEHLGQLSAYAAALTDIGSVRRLTGDLPGAVDALTRALEISRAAGNRLYESNALTGLGIVRHLTGDLPGAADALTQALEISRAAGNRLSEATALTEQAQVRHSTGDFPAAIDAADRAVEIFRELGNRNGEATAMTSLGRVRSLTGDYPAANDALTQALEIYRGIGNRDGQANALNDLGRVWERTGNYPGAANAANQALEIYREIGNRLGEANAQITVGRARYLTGDIAEASESHTRALEICREIGNRLGEASALTELGRIWQSTGDSAKASDTLARALDIYRAIGNQNGEAWALNYYAAALAAVGEQSRALVLRRQALAMNRRLNKPDDEALSLEGIAEHYIATGNPAQATEYLRQALDIYQRLGMPPDIRRVQTCLADLAAG